MAIRLTGPAPWHPVRLRPRGGTAPAAPQRRSPPGGRRRPHHRLNAEALHGGTAARLLGRWPGPGPGPRHRDDVGGALRLLRYFKATDQDESSSRPGAPDALSIFGRHLDRAVLGILAAVAAVAAEFDLDEYDMTPDEQIIRVRNLARKAPSSPQVTLPSRPIAALALATALATATALPVAAGADSGPGPEPSIRATVSAAAEPQREYMGMTCSLRGGYRDQRAHDARDYGLTRQSTQIVYR